MPRLSVALDGRSLWLHLETFGSASQPPVFVLPGGPGADFRLLEPLTALSDEYFLVFWDPHGGGLSQRVSSRSALALDVFDEEIAAVQAVYAPDQPIRIIGHSFGADLALRYAGRHPGQVSALALIEPGPITVSARQHRAGSWVGLDVFESVFWDNQLLTASDHARADYRLLGALRPGSSGFYCAGEAPEEFPIWRFGAYSLEMVPRAEANLDYTEPPAPDLPRLIVAGTCGDLSADFQEKYNLPAVPGAQLVRVEGAGHISLFLEHAAQTVAAVRSFLEGQP